MTNFLNFKLEGSNTEIMLDSFKTFLRRFNLVDVLVIGGGVSLAGYQLSKYMNTSDDIISESNNASSATEDRIFAVFHFYAENATDAFAFKIVEDFITSKRTDADFKTFLETAAIFTNSKTSKEDTK